MNKLNRDEQDALSDLLSYSDGVKALYHQMDLVLGRIQQSVLKYNLENGNPEQLAFLKSRAEGAERLVQSLKTELEQIRRPKPLSSTNDV